MKVLLQSKHLQTHGAFDREYNAVARRVEPGLVGSGPRKAQFYRWLSGGVAGLPYPHHCRILEAMFPDYTAGQLFAESVGTQNYSTSKVCGGGPEIVTTYATRSELLRNLPPTELFPGVTRADIVGISLNLFCQQFPDPEIVELLRSGAQIRCLFLDPNSRHTADREREEGQPAGSLTALTRLNISALRRIVQQIAAEDFVGTLTIRTYDAPARFNIAIVDRTCVCQPYLPTSRGVESPAFVVDADSSGLYATFSGVFETLWASGAEPVDDRR
ncbi:DUF5919 domain-containing protein [Nocardia mangyaensis]|uniref:DUF5919 domain-containing protein n=1 Tax=Nocardia mangyaensis TaxID=2213200 RepID=UPI00197FAC54|nr:DUF5919 domain-containing protein [Nocardia mangyaensis]